MAIAFQSPRFAGNAELERILNSPDDGSDKLQRGSRGDGVCRVQKAIFDLGFAPVGVLERVFVDRVYGQQTEQAVLAYKKHYGIRFPPDDPNGSVDGLTGPRTLRKLDEHCFLLDEGIAAIEAKVRRLRDRGVAVEPGPIASILDNTPGVVRASTIAGAAGAIYYRRGIGAFEVHGAIFAAYTQQHGGPEGDLGYPTSDEHEDGPDFLRSDFEQGPLRFDRRDNTISQLGPQEPSVAFAATPSQRVVVKLANDVNVPYVDGVEQHLTDLAGPAFAALQSQFPFLTLDRLFDTVEPPEIEALIERVGDTTGELLSYFAVQPPPGVDAQALATALQEGLGVVEHAYAELESSRSSFVSPDDDPLSVQQAHLGAAPIGVDARFAWTLFGGDGTGVQVIDVEGDWELDHEDLVDQAIPVAQGRASGIESDIEHGTKVLGLLVASDNGVGVVGVVPHASARVAAEQRADNGQLDRANLLLLLAAGHRPDDTTVVLLELQSGRPDLGQPLQPAEIEPAVNTLIRGLVASGVTVVEPAGNGGLDLDMFVNGSGQSSTRANDSGAIMVGACLNPAGTFSCGFQPRQRAVFSNHGARIDCFASGGEVTTTSTIGSDPPKRRYTSGFAGTSCAAAIVAGAAVATLGMAKAASIPLTPAIVRTVLSDPAVNTPSAFPGADRIGVMPNLQAIARRIGVI